ncbi:MAG TPA: phosphodiester glycosidase family protein [Sandaracinaceae bacterium]
MRARARTLLALSVCAASILWTPAGSIAQDTWSTPYPGVRYLFRRASGPRRIHALVVDLCAPGVSIRATASSERRQTVPSFGSAVGAEAAVNADFFSFETYAPSGAAMHAGTAWNDDDSSNGFLAFGPERFELSVPSRVVHPMHGWAREVVGGHPMILRNGEVVSNTGSLCTARHPRTAAGISRDRQTLYLVVVDGRSSASIGMTCAEEAELLKELGAWDALNLDGGGSSTMWIRGRGVVNAPSDGTPRVVANHLAVQATGSGIPGSCMPWEPEESEWVGSQHDESQTSDIDGDGRADACARGPDGVRCHLSSGSSFAAESVAAPALSDATGWGAARHWATIAMGDVTGDGLADLCARATAGMRCWPSTGAALDGEAIAGPAWSNDAGWGVPERWATIRLADVDGDGRDDLCGRSDAGFVCATSTGTGFAPEWAPLGALSDASGWDALARWSSIRMGDVNGDGLADVCGRGAAGVDCWLSTGAGFDPEPVAGPRWSDDAGWSAHRYTSTIRLVDVDGDGRADLCARSASDFRCHLSQGSSFGDAIVLDAMSDASGWDDYANYSTIRMPDLDGDGDREVCARANAGIRCWPWEGAGFGAAITGPELSDAEGWGYAPHYRTIRFADIDGDGDDDLCARAYSRVWCWLSEGTSFGARIDGPPWGNPDGWIDPRYHATIRIASRRARPEPAPPDAGTPGPDASGIAPDAGAPSDPPDGGASAPVDAGGAHALGGGCACRAGRARTPAGAALAILFAVAGALARRRR